MFHNHNFDQFIRSSFVDGYHSINRNVPAIWDKNDSLLIEIIPKFQFYDVLFSPDGQLLIFHRNDGMLSIWGVKRNSKHLAALFWDIY
jgi:WD40 repeat protein